MEKMLYWKVKTSVICGKNYNSVIKEALSFYLLLEKSSRRKTYIKSPAFAKQKVFLNNFWIHLHQKNPKDRRRRLRYYKCAIELLQNSTYKPELSRPKKSQKFIFSRLYGITSNAEKFVVQIKESKKGEKHLLSIFPYTSEK